MQVSGSAPRTDPQNVRFVKLCHHRRKLLPSPKGKIVLFGLLVTLVLLGNFAECDTPEAADAQVPATLMDELPPIADDRKGTGPKDEQASLIHPRLSELLGTVMPHEFDKIFMDKKLPLESLLALPVASIPCAEATKSSPDSSSTS